MTSDFDPQQPGQNGEPRAERQIIDLEFGTLRDFRQEMAPRLAEDGMFVSTREPLARGTPVLFRFVLPEEFVLAQGEAVVAWRRTKATHPDLEPGMALWFEELPKQSRDIIHELVDIQATSGDAVFDTRRKAAEVGDFKSNEFAGAFATSFDLPALESPPKPEAPAPDIPRQELVLDMEEPVSDSRERDVAPVSEAPAFENRERVVAPASEGALPGWLSEAEKRQQIESESEGSASAEATRDFAAPEPMASGEADFEVSMMTDDSGPDVTPLSEEAGSLPDLEVLLGDTDETPRRSRLWHVAGLVVVLLAVASVVVWWVFNRPQEPPGQEVQQVAVAEPTNPAVVLLDDSNMEPVATPLAIVEDEAQTMMEAPAEIGPATQVVDIGVARLGDSTVIGIRGNGDFEGTRLQVSMLEGPSRVLVRIAGIETFYRPNEIEVGSPEVSRVRVGHHPELTPVKLYVVLDLADESVVIQETSVSGDTIRIVVGGQ